MLDSGAILEDPRVLILIGDSEGRVRDCNPSAANRLRYARDSLLGLHWRDIAEWASGARLLELARSPLDALPATERVVLRRSDGERVPLAAALNTVSDAGGGRGLRLLGIEDAEYAAYVAKLEHATALLNGFADASSEAMWCIEYTEPVDVTAGAQEIVRQMFEHECQWGMCNRAMARLYNLPEGLDFNRTRVSSYFFRSSENEAFVRQLIDSGFTTNAVPSLEVRHDGTLVYLESSVRCHIEDGKMLRMWGTARNTTEYRTAQNRLAQQEREVREILSALPDAVLVVDKGKRVVAVNSAFETTFAWSADLVLGRAVTQIIDLDMRREDEPRWFVRAQQRWTANVKRSDGNAITCDIRMAPLHEDDLCRFVLSLRPMLVAPAARRRKVKRKRRGARGGGSS
jgi:PAS domain S-box-containing protein